MERTIVRIQGGLGNQMFQYALFLWLTKKGFNTLLDISHYNYKYKGDTDAVHNGYELEKVFHIDGPYATLEQVKEVGSIEVDLTHRLQRKIFGIKKTHIKQADMKLNELYVPEIVCKTPAYIDGYWCTFRYAEDICEDVKKAFQFTDELDDKNKRIMHQIKNTNSVSIHIRHGDYLKLQGHYMIPTISYYKQAMGYIQEQEENSVFYCFSDDIDWCRNNFDNKSIEYIDWNTGKDSHIDMFLMSECKHNIIANSTFSMWAAWLNNNDGKIIIRPQHVYANPDNEKKDMFPENWIAM